jgi:nitroreductase
MRAALEAAALAPSLHNTQPWTFRVDDDAIEVYLDRARGLPVADASRREQILSCSTAVFNMRVAAAAASAGVQVVAFPDPAHVPDLVARVRFTGEPADGPTQRLAPLAGVIRHRHTNRQPFDDRPVPARLREALSAAVTAEGAQLSWSVSPYVRHWLATLDAEAERDDRYDPARREERAVWVGGDRSVDGVPSSALGPRPLGSRPVTRDLAAHPDDLRRDRARFEAQSSVAVLHTVGDQPRDWWAAGQALERAWLVATDFGLSVSFRNSALEYRPLRWLLRDPTAGRLAVQMVLRVGYGPTVSATPRRALADMVEPVVKRR